jgi:uncharacterized protein DUF4349
MKFSKGTVILVVLLSTALACNHKQGSSEELAKTIPQIRQEDEKKYKAQANQIVDTSASPPQSPQVHQPANAGSAPVTDWDKKIVKNGSINVETKNYKSFTALMRDNIKKFGAYIAQEEQNQNDYKIENTVAIKVPVDQFDNLVNELTKDQEKIIELKVTSEDVTTDIVDTKSRLEAKKQVRLRYLDLLKQARSMQDILHVQNEINGIQEDIEAAAGRIDYLSHSSSFSTISLTYFQVLNASAKDTAEPSYGTKVWLSFKNGWNWIGEVVVGIISIWPLFLLAFACWFAYKKWLLSKMHKRNA